MSVRQGMIGSGMIGQEHIKNIKLRENAQVAAVADIDPAMRGTSSKSDPMRVGGATEHSAKTGRTIEMDQI